MIAIGSDHAGYDLKEEIKAFLDSEKISYQDFGTCSKASTDYPDYALEISKAVVAGKCEKGIMICGTGIGISIAANKVPGIRAALCTNAYMARMAKEHNDANVLALGGRVIGAGTALDIVKAFIDTPYSEGANHQKRIAKINKIEDRYMKHE